MKIWAILVGGLSSRTKTALAKGTNLDLLLLHGITASILQCISNPWAVGLLQESTLVFGVLYGKIGKNAIWVTLTPRISESIHCTKTMTYLANSLSLGLQRGAYSISLQCIPLAVGWSEWGACLTPFNCEVFGGK